MERKLGWKRDLPDSRDYGIRAVFPKAAVQLPRRIDMRDGCSDVEDQGNLGSCTGNGSAGVLEFLEIKGGTPKASIVQKSRLFIYYNGRPWYLKSSDSGARIRDVIKGMAKYGACDETIWPYDTPKFSATPSRASYVDGSRNEITVYARLDASDPASTLSNIRETLASGYPVVFGFDCYDNALSADVAGTGNVRVPDKTESLQGGHCVVAVGYDDDTGALIFRNSWGTGWGMKGYGTLPYWYVTSGHASDFWVIKAQASDRPGLSGILSGSIGWLYSNIKAKRTVQA